MDKIKFIEQICIPYITLALNTVFLSRDNETNISKEKFNLEKIGEWFTPWYTDLDGKGCEYNSPGALPMKVKDTLNCLDPNYSSHKNHIEKINYFAEILKQNQNLIYAPVQPVVGFDNKKTFIIFDGNHRLVGSLLSGSLKEIEVLIVKSNNMKEINVDFRYHS
jgi:hypothetical protein